MVVVGIGGSGANVFAGVTGGVGQADLDVFSEQDLNERDKFWKMATQHRWRNGESRRFAMTADRVHQVPAPKPLWVALDHVDRVA